MEVNYVVDWQQTNEKTVGSLVSVRLAGRKAGIYRVKRVMPEGMLLSHGAISFPVGTQLDVEDIEGGTRGRRQHVRVMANDRQGLCLAWQAEAWA
jgi:hypothetical protein